MPAPSETEPTREGQPGTDEAGDAEGVTVCCVPGLCWDCEADKERYAKVDGPGDDEDEDDDSRVLYIVDEYTGGMIAEPSYDLGGELPPDFCGRSLRGLTVLTEVARRKLDTERWDTDGPWRLWWTYCGNEVTDPLDETEDIESSGGDVEGGSGKTHYYVTVRNEGDAHTVEVVGTHGTEDHVMYEAPVPEPDGESQDTETLEGLHSLLERATGQVREAGYEINGDWTVDWTRCRVLLAD